jgi:hypothetical protein
MLTITQKEDGQKLALPMVRVDMATSENMVLDEQSYREAVETLLRLRSDKTISNSMPSHAAVLFEVFLKRAQQQVRVFCRNLSNEVWGNPAVVEAAKNALQRGINLSILIQEDSPDSGPFAELLNDNRTDPHLRFYTMEGENLRNAPVNFAVMDETAFRFEKDRKECKAFAVMFSPNLASSLSRQFDAIFRETSLIKAPAHFAPGI